jgi:thiamine kinase-like enzyme
VADHPAVRAWATLYGTEPAPYAVDLLERTRKTSTYRLHGLGRGRERVIGKRADAAKLEVERIVYQELLDHLPLRSLHCYGLLEVGSSAWLFLEDADHGVVEPVTKNQQWSEVARWLATLHGAAASASVRPHLPHRGPDHYLLHLGAARTLLRQNVAHPAFYDEDRETARRLLTLLDEIEASWGCIERICGKSPNTLVHGDLQPKNLRLRVEHGTAVVLSFDWETAGWGVPAADLAGLVDRSDDAALQAYVSELRSTWPDMDAAQIPSLAQVGHVFRLLSSVWWAALGLEHAWIGRSRWKLRCYRSDLERAVTALRVVGVR